MNNNDCMENATLAFKNKKYHECFQALKKLSTISRSSRSSRPSTITNVTKGALEYSNEIDITLVQEFKVENFTIIADYMWRSSVEDKTKSLLYNEMVQRLDALLQKTRSTPVGSDCLSTELMVLYNWLYQRCLQMFSKDPPIHTLTQQDMVDSFLQSLVRVQTVLKTSFTPTQNLNKPNGDLILEFIDQCVLNFGESQSDDKLTTAFLLVCCLWSAIQMHDGKTCEALQCLQYLENKINVNILNYSTELGLVLPVGPVVIGNSCDDSHQSVRLSDVLHFLLAHGFFKEKEFKSCKEQLKKVEFAPWTVYMKYLEGVIMYEEKEYVDVINMLETFKGDNCTDSRMKALTASLVGCCMAKLGHPHSAIQKYREAIEEDFTFLLPMYNMSAQYNKLQLYDAELESLNLLVTASESQSRKSSSDSSRSLVHGLLGCTGTITPTQAMYALARRCLESKRYDVASEKYLDVLSYIDQYGFQQDDSDAVCIPTLQKIYHETLYALLCAGNYDDCVHICDRLISCQFEKKAESICEGSELSIIDLQPSQTSPFFSGTRKRQRSETIEQSFTDTLSCLPGMNEGTTLVETVSDVTAFVYKGDALVQLHKYKEASNCLHRAVEILQTCNPDIEVNATANSSSIVERKAKRQRLDSGNCASKQEEPCILPPTSAGSMLAEVLEKLGISLALQDRNFEALHFLRLSLQLNPGKTKAMYNITLVLWKLERQKEAALGWAEFRKIQIKSESFQLGTELRSKQNKLKSLSCDKDQETTDKPTLQDISDKEILLLDIACIEYLIKFRRGL